MGFSIIEKQVILEQLQPLTVVETIRDQELVGDFREYLQNQNYLRNIRDYAIIPKGKNRINKSENITVVKYYARNLDFAKYVDNICSYMTLPFEIKIDFNFSAIKPTEEDDLISKYRYIWAQRSTSFDVIQKLETPSDVDELLTILRTMSYTDLLSTTYINHMNQSSFDRSGYNPHILISSVLFLSKLAHDTVADIA